VFHVVMTEIVNQMYIKTSCDIIRCVFLVLQTKYTFIGDPFAFFGFPNLHNYE
jgi:hypothetical protein